MTRDRYKSILNPRIKDKIKKFFESGRESIELENMSPQYLCDYAESVGADVVHQETDTNGWQVDYWVPCTYDEQKYYLHGSAWYGTAEIFKEEEE